jgi:hypothetical protein
MKKATAQDVVEILETEETVEGEKTVAKKADAKKAKETPIKLTRIEANLKAIHKLGIDAKPDEIAKAADTLYCKSGGTSNLKEAKWHAGFGLKFFDGAQKAGFAIETGKNA